MDGNDENEEDPLRFPIQDTNGSAHMNNIPPSSKISWSKVRGFGNISL